MKIALCISGETREYNKYFAPTSLIQYLRSKGCTVDIYGHTWSDCVVPEETDTIKFKELLIEDQAIIDRWVDKNPNKHGWDTPRPANMQADEWFGRLYHNTRIHIGQHIGGIHCLRMPDENEYDLYVRWRWDLELKTIKDWDIQLLENNFYPMLEWASTRSEAIGLTSCESFYNHYGPCLEDSHYFFNKLAMSPINQLDYHEEILRFWITGKTSFHILWNKLLAEGCFIRLSTRLPNLVYFKKSSQHKHDPIFE